MSNLNYLVFTALLFIIAYAYFRVARRYKIVDLPNHRTMHDGATIRGGGVVVWFGMIAFAGFFHNPGIYFFLGLVLIGLTGLLDDLVDLSSKIRFPIQAISVVFILIQLGLLNSEFIWLLIIVIIATGILNAFNFMDGINGMTAGYSLVFVSTIIYINYYIQNFIQIEFLYGYFLSLLVFSFFNFRNKAVCFAGDVGSLTIAFINIFLLLALMAKSQNLIFVFFFTVYGIDTVFTIIQRLFHRENIFEAHKLHLFQEIVSHADISHLKMTGSYMLIQLLINAVIVYILNYAVLAQWLIIFLVLFILSVTYILLKIRIVKTKNVL